MKDYNKLFVFHYCVSISWNITLSLWQVIVYWITFFVNLVLWWWVMHMFYIFTPAIARKSDKNCGCILRRREWFQPGNWTGIRCFGKCQVHSREETYRWVKSYFGHIQHVFSQHKTVRTLKWSHTVLSLGILSTKPIRRGASCFSLISSQTDFVLLFSRWCRRLELCKRLILFHACVVVAVVLTCNGSNMRAVTGWFVVMESITSRHFYYYCLKSGCRKHF